MRKTLSILLTLVLIATLFTACGKNNATAKTGDTNGSSASTLSSDANKNEKESSAVKVATLKGPTGMGMAYLIDDSNSGKTEGNYEFEVCASPDEVTSRIVSGELDIAAVPTNAAATLYNKTNGKVKLLALNTECVLYILEKGNTIKSVSDLRGKTIYVSGQGSTPEYVLNYILEKNGLTPGKDVTLDFTYSTHSDLVAFAASGKADVVMLPEPTVTALLAKNSDFRVALDIDDLWEDLIDDTANEDAEIAMGCLVVNTEFSEKNPDAVKIFLKEYEASVDKIDEDEFIDQSAAVIEKVGIVENAAVAKKALPRCNICFEKGIEMKEEVGDFLKLLFDAEPNSVGGKLPDDNFYYIEK